MSLPQHLPLNLMQTQWGQQLNPVIANPIVQGLAITGISLAANTPTVIPTTLGRMQQGWFVTDIQSNGGSWLFGVSSASATVGATYTNNSITFTVVNTISGGLQLFATGINAPTVSGTLTKATGTGDTTITFSSAIESQSVGSISRTQPFNSTNLTLESTTAVTISIWVY